MKRNPLICFVCVLCFSIVGLAQKNEIAVSVGALTSTDQKEQFVLPVACTINDPNCNRPNFTTDTGVAFEATIARTLFHLRVFDLQAEIPIMGSPARGVRDNSIPAGRGVSSLFFTPSAKFKLLPAARISPFAVVGGGLAHFRSFGTDNNTGAFEFGGGVDFKTPLPRLGFRAEVRDFFSGTSIVQSSPGVIPLTSHQHNVFAGGGLVLHF